MLQRPSSSRNLTDREYLPVRSIATHPPAHTHPPKQTYTHKKVKMNTVGDGDGEEGEEA